MQDTHFEGADFFQCSPSTLANVVPLCRVREMNADPTSHGPNLAEKCGCGIGDDAPTGSDRQVTNLEEPHHCIMEYMDTRTIKNRPGARNLVTALRESLMRTEGYSHTHMGGPEL